jgi:hypothetical protein
MLTSFPFAATLAALVCATGCVVVLRLGKKQADLPSRLPRSRVLGELVGIPVLAWAAYHVTQMVQPGSVFIPIAIGLVPAVSVIAWGHLDYLFARALGGLLLLGANHLLTVAFVAEVPSRPFFSTFVYLIGLPGLFLVSSPWWMRNLLEKTRDSGTWRNAVAVACTFYAVFFAVYAVIGR